MRAFLLAGLLDGLLDGLLGGFVTILREGGKGRRMGTGRQAG